MTKQLRGKDYCNCEHAQMLRYALIRAYDDVVWGDWEAVKEIIRTALHEDADAKREYLNV